MPNHVDHDIWIHTDEKDYEPIFQEFDRFWNAHLKDLSATLIPYPPERARINRPRDEWLAAHPDKHKLDYPDHTFHDWYNQGGYEWCCEHWGSKWGLYNLATEYKCECYTCQSAWKPSEPLYLALSRRFPKIKFTINLFEKGMQWSIHYKIKNGQILEKEKATYWGRRGG